MKYLSNHYLNTVYLWVFLILVTFAFTNIYTLTLTIAYTGYFPYINAVLWLSISETGKKIRDKLEIWHWAVLISYIVFIYSIYAQTWSASILNDTFPVDPGKFAITHSITTVLIAPINLLYYPDFLGFLHTISILISMFVVPLLGMALLVGFPMGSTFKSIGKLFLGIFCVSFFVTIMFSFNNQLNNVITKLAISTDFNKNHPCSNKWAEKAESLIFLGGERVYVYSPTQTQDKVFQFETCDFKAASNKNLKADS